MPAKQRAVLLYPRNRSAKLDPTLFAHPTSEYRGTPFWSWNNRLDVPQLLRQIVQFKRMGFGGFHIHSRIGLDTEYLGEAFMQAVVACTRKAEQESMLCWLYDEDRWPSGFAGGLVTKDRAFRSRHLLWTCRPYSGLNDPSRIESQIRARRTENGRLLARYHVVLKDGCLHDYRRLKENEKPPANGRVWYAYLETAQPNTRYNGQTYIDTFDAMAAQRFIEITHERFKQQMGRWFGTTIPAIFTDEPQFTKKTTFQRADDASDLIFPFTPDFFDTYFSTYGHRLEERLPELFWNLPDGEPSLARYCFHDHSAERFASGFADVLGRWCEKNGIALTGHLLGEPALFSQTRGIGEAMRPLRAFQLPGIDILFDRIEFTTAKQTQSIAHQYGREGVASELYGVTNWDFDFAGHKRQGDWQAALGVTIRVPHLAWVSMAGEAKRDYPAPIGYQSPWHEQYRLIEDHFSRINTVLTRGKPLVRVGVIHPVESFWLCFGPLEQNSAEMQEREEAHEQLAQWLIHGLIDFNYISEGLLPGQAVKRASKRFGVGRMRYDAVVVPALRTIRRTTLQRLESFAQAGGTIIFAGQIPDLVDARRSSDPVKLAERSMCIPWTRRRLLEALRPYREIDVRRQDGTPAETLVHQIRIDGRCRRVFLCNIDRDRAVPQSEIRLRGRWSVQHLDTLQGSTTRLPARIESGQTLITHSFPAHGSLLLTLEPYQKRNIAVPPAPEWKPIARLEDPVPVTLSEPNVLLLDRAAWRLLDKPADDSSTPWQTEQELLRIDALVRKSLNLPLRGGAAAQPWSDRSPAPALRFLQLRFKITSDVNLQGAKLALESPADARITLNGKPISIKNNGWWVDESIRTIALPSFRAGEHILQITLPFTRRTDLEWCYLLGDFGVSVTGRHARIVPFSHRLAFGDWTRQGLPFYAGNVTYHCAYKANKGDDLLLEVPRFRNPLLTVSLNGKPIGPIAFAPYQLPLGRVSGKLALDITAYGNRVNAFGPVHNSDEHLKGAGPPAWHTSGPHWSDEHQLRPTGIVQAPILHAKQ